MLNLNCLFEVEKNVKEKGGNFCLLNICYETFCLTSITQEHEFITCGSKDATKTELSSSGQKILPSSIV